MAVDGSYNAEAASRYALAIAKAYQAQFFLAFVVTEETERALLHSAQESVDRILAQAQEHRLSFQAITQTGKVVPILKSIVEKEGIDLALFATRHKDTKGGFFVQTVAQSLTLSLPCSVVIVRSVQPGRMAHPRHVLIPLTYEHDSGLEEQAAFAAHLINYFRAKAVVFHVHNPLSYFGLVKGASTSEEKGVPPSDNLKIFMSILKKNAIQPEIRVVQSARPGKAIYLEAAAQKHDLILMGATQRSFLKRAMEGNPVEEMLRETPCDIMIHRPGGSSSRR